MGGPEDSVEEFGRLFETVLDGHGHGQSLQLDQKQLKSMLALHRIVSRKPQSTSGGVLSETCKDLMAECRVRNPVVEQLIHLLSSSSIRALFDAHDEVASKRFEPRLPDIPWQVDEDDGIAIKVVRLVKGQEPLGATIKCESDGRVVIARVLAGGVADRSGCILTGDRVVQVNGVCLQGKSASEVVKLMASSEGDTITLKLVPTAITITTKDNRNRVHVRALFDYNPVDDRLHPCPEAGLIFHRGEVLELLVCDDEHWWQARNLGLSLVPDDDGNNRHRVGLVPSQLLQQKRSISDKSGHRSRQPSSSNEMTENRRGYESVAQLYPPSVAQLYPRPIVLIGASGVGRNELKRRLLVMNPDRYATTIPHTSRKPRANEKNGVDYHFVDRDQMENWMRSKLFLEYGEYRGNLYGTMLESVRSLIESGYVPVLNPHPLALARLRNQEFKPFFIFVQPPPFDVLKETRQRHRTFGDSSRVRIFTDNELEQMISTSVQLDKHYGHWWDARLVNENLDIAFDQLTILLDRAEQEPTWVPTAWTVPRSPLSAFDDNQ